jgi:hypothetical protein
LVDARRIDQNDLRVFAIEDALNAIAGGLRFRRDDGDFLADESIDERGFARVGAADDCDETRLKWHGLTNCTPLRCGAEVRQRRGRGIQKICHRGTETSMKASSLSRNTGEVTRPRSCVRGARPGVNRAAAARDLCAQRSKPLGPAASAACDRHRC